MFDVSKEQTNPKRYGELIAETVDDTVNNVIVDLTLTEHNFLWKGKNWCVPWLAGGLFITATTGVPASISSQLLVLNMS